MIGKNKAVSAGVLALGLSLAAVFSLAGCSKPAPSAAQPGAPGGSQRPGGQAGGRRSALVPVQATTVQVGLLTAQREASGVVAPVIQSQVAAQVAGVVKSVPRVSGDWVNAGALVVQLDDAQLKLALNNAQASLDNARINLQIGEDNASQDNPKLSFQVQSAQSALDSAQKFYDSQKALYDLGGLAASALDTAESQLTAAKANLEGAKTALDQNNKSGDQTIAQLKLAVTQAQNQLVQGQLNLQYASIRAPFAGQIASINMQPGMYVGLNTPAFSLVSSDREISFSIPPSDAATLPLGSKIAFSYSGSSFPVKVSQAPSAPINGVVPMAASVPVSFKLAYGAVGSVSYTISVASGILVPLASLATLEDKNYVFAIVDGKATRKDVTIVGEAGITAAVAGIAPGDVVIISPPPGLIQGSQVQVVAQQAAAETTGAQGQVPAQGQAPSTQGAPASQGKAGRQRSGSGQAQGSGPAAAGQK